MLESHGENDSQSQAVGHEESGGHNQLVSHEGNDGQTPASHENDSQNLEVSDVPVLSSIAE